MMMSRKQLSLQGQKQRQLSNDWYSDDEEVDLNTFVAEHDSPNA
jgi:hypothetical protein